MPRTNKRTWILKYLQEGVNKLKMYLRILANPLVIKTCGIDSRSLCGHFKTHLRKIHRGNPTLEVIKLEKVPRCPKKNEFTMRLSIFIDPPLMQVFQYPCSNIIYYFMHFRTHSPPQAKILSILELANIFLHCRNPFQNGFLERKSH